MKATFNEKQMMRDSMEAIASMAKKVYLNYIESGTITMDMDPLIIYPIIAQTAADIIELQANGLPDKERIKRINDLTERYTKIDYDGSNE